MASNVLADRYKQYKAGTSTLVNWLADTARRYCGEVSDFASILKISKDSSKANEETKAPLTTTDLLKLAKAIAASSITIPQEILTIAKDVIARREAFANFYGVWTNSEDTNGRDSNKRHRHFIHVLREITQLLHRGYDTASHTRYLKAQRSSDEQDHIGFSNLFSGLEVEEPSMTPLAAPSDDQLEFKTGKEAPYAVEFELQDSDADEVFAIWCLLTDFRDLRKYVEVVWTDFKSGTLSFGTASMTTNLAFYTMMQMEHELSVSFPYLRHYANLLDIRQVGMGTIDKTVMLYPKRQNQAPRMENKTPEELCELFCPEAAMIMVGFRDATANLKQDQRPPDDRRSDYVRFARVHDFGIVLMEKIRPVIQRLHAKGERLTTSLDPFTDGLLYLASHPKMMPIWLVGACQIYMDLSDLLGTDEATGLSCLKARAKHDQVVSQDYYNSDGAPIRDRADCPHDEAFRSIAYVSKCFLADALPNYEEGENQCKVSTGAKMLTDDLSRSLPLLPSFQCSISASFVSSTGLRMCNQDRVMLTAAHLYRATLKMGLVDQKWQDMEFLIDSQSKKRPFMWDSDPRSEAAARHFGISLGIKVSAFSDTLQPAVPRHQTVVQRGRQLDEDFPLMDALFKRGMKRYDATFDQNVIIETVTKSLLSLEKTSPNNTSINELRKQLRSSGKFNAKQLLQGARKVFMAQEMELHFNYVRFYIICRALFFAIKEVCRKSLPAPGSSGIGDWEKYPYELSYAALWELADSQRTSTSLKATMMYEIGKVLRALIQKDGDQCVKAALKQQIVHKQDTKHVGISASRDLDEKSFSEELARIFPLYHSCGIPIPEIHNSKPLFCNSYEDLKWGGIAASAIHDYRNSNSSTDRRQVSSSWLRVQTLQNNASTDAQRIDMDREAVDTLHRKAGEMTQYAFDMEVNAMLDNFQPDEKKYLKEKMEGVPRMVAKEERETRERGKPWAGDEVREAAKKGKGKGKGKK